MCSLVRYRAGLPVSSILVGLINLHWCMHGIRHGDELLGLHQ
jgi:hypothetical protein